LAKETIQAVRQAEQKAEQIEKDAAMKAEAIVMNAYEQAKELETSMTKDALAKAQEELERAQLQGVDFMEAANNNADIEIKQLYEIVKNKEEAVIKLVLSEII
jgi:V/A-type H+/Na+-transporting ATPase subunit G/H